MIETFGRVSEYQCIDTYAACVNTDNPNHRNIIPIKMKYLTMFKPGTVIRITVEEVKEKDDPNES